MTLRNEKRKKVGLVEWRSNMTGICQALTNVNEQIVDWEEQQRDKEECEQETSKEIRKIE